MHLENQYGFGKNKFDKAISESEMPSFPIGMLGIN